MSDDIKKDRSPSCPKVPLQEAIEWAARLHQKAGKASIRPEVAAAALGYRGINGASLGTLATLSQYGLIDKERAGNLSISALALKLLHPLSHTHEMEARATAATLPRVFAELMEGGHHHCDESVLTNHLIHISFTPEGAKRAASVFKANVEFANLGGQSVIESIPSATTESKPPQSGPVLSHEAKSRLPLLLSGAPAAKTPALAVDWLPVSSPAQQELPILLDGDRMARIPYPMSQKTFDRFLKMLELYHDTLVVEDELKSIFKDE